MLSHWKYRGEDFNEIPENAYGFVYRITNISSGKMYIGKKQFISVRRKKVPGKTRRKVVKTEMKWREYTGSNKLLNEHILEQGKDNFKFEVLALAYTKGQLSYLEENVQHKLNAIVSPNFYNDSIGSRGFINLKITSEFKDALENMEL